MKKLMLVAGFAALSLVACNKKEDASSRIQEGATNNTEVANGAEGSTTTETTQNLKTKLNSKLKTKEQLI